jgi:sec-independent protein translocase protein TatB
MMVSPPMQLGSLGMADSLILMVLALVVFGPRRLPQIGRQIGKLMYEFRKASNDFKFQMEEELRQAEEADRRKKEEEQQKQRALAAPPQESVSADPQTVNAVLVQPKAVVTDARAADATAEVTLAPNVESVAAETAAGTSDAAASGLTIAPPSTGETVGALPPWKKMQSAHAPQAAVSEAATSNGTGAGSEATDAVSRNG